MLRTCLKSCLRRKLVTTDSPRTSLKRVLGPWQLVALGVGITVGAGLFSLTGLAAGQYAGPAVGLSFLISAIACSFAGLCYAELSGMLPVGGSAYSYSYAALGEFAAWMIGWDLILEYTVAVATVASSWSGYIASLMADWNIIIDPRFLAPPMTNMAMPDGHMAHAWFNAPSIIILVVITLLLMRGTQLSSRVNSFLVFLKLLVIATVIILCLPLIRAEHYIPYIPANTGSFGHFGISGLMRAAALVFVAYVGFDAVSTAAQDTRNPQKNVPLGIIGSLIATALIYVIFSSVLIGVVDYRTLANDPNPVATVIRQLHQPWIATFIKIAITLSYGAVIYGMLLGQSRIAMTMAEDGLIPISWARLHQKTRTPWTAHILTGTASAFLAACLPISTLGDMTSIGTLLAFIFVCLSTIRLRYTHPDTPRLFQLPGGAWIIPLLGILSCSIVILSMTPATWLKFALWMCLGLLLYVTYGYRKSLLSRQAGEENTQMERNEQP